MDQKLINKIINLKSPLLITGETGTGKSHLAKKIFDLSKINRDKFLTVHLASLKEDLIESELFGHKRGSFTGAVDNKTGYLADVAAGTLFLDEIGELSLTSQKKLLYLMEEKKFTPLGSSTAIPFRGRIIMATNRNLEEMVKSGSFREDLYYRIKTFHLILSPLHESPDCLSAHIDSLFNELKNLYLLPYARLSEETKVFLMSLKWKGNLRELKNALEYALVLSERNIIAKSDFPDYLKELPFTHEHSASFFDCLPEDYTKSLEAFEKQYFKNMLRKNNGRVNETAKKIGISKTTLIQKARRYEINTLQMRADALFLAA